MVRELGLPGVLVLAPVVHADHRGCFFESFNQRAFQKATGQAAAFVQDNHSVSRVGVVRGLHYQVGHPQGKLVRVVRGSIFDVAVDLRRSSPTFGKWVGQVLTESNRLQLWVPPGFAHGFMALSPEAEVLYKTTDYWAPTSGRCIRWDDPTLAIAWPAGCGPHLSDKDLAGASFLEAEVYD